MKKIYLSTGLHNPPKGTENMDVVDVYTYFPDAFMQSHTKHQNFSTFIDVICSTLTKSEFDKLNNGDYDNLVHQHSDFESWEAMCEAANAYHENKKDI